MSGPVGQDFNCLSMALIMRQSHNVGMNKGGMSVGTSLAL